MELIRRLESSAIRWDKLGKPSGLLWRNPDLYLLEDLYKRKKDELTVVQTKFYKSSAHFSMFKPLLGLLWFFGIILFIVGAFLVIMFLADAFN